MTRCDPRGPRPLLRAPERDSRLIPLGIPRTIAHLSDQPGEGNNMSDIFLARIRSVPAGGSYRVLVDRLWPRGVRKRDAPWDEWIKEVAPSTELRQWYSHDPSRYEEFRQRYLSELRSAMDDPAMVHLLELVRSRPITLLTATGDLQQSQVPVLASFLRATTAGITTAAGGSA